MASSGEDNAAGEEHSLNQLYLAIISRYRDYIEEKEHISVAELPTLVNPKDEAVSKRAMDIMKGYGEYSFSRDFASAGMEAFAFIRDGVRQVSMPLEFWLTPGETMAFRVGDVMDRNTLLCSLLIALGNPSAKVLVVIDEGSRRVVTYYEIDGAIRLYDLAAGHRDFRSRAEMIESLGTGEDSSVYEFNDKMYVDIS